MPSAFGHAVAALAIAKASPRVAFTVRTALLGVLCAVVPDADVVAFSLDIPYEHVLGHRGITHSFAFAAVLAWMVGFSYPVAQRSFGLWLVFFLATASHPLLDMCTSGGLGCALFAPFHNARYFFPWRPIAVSPIEASAFFGEWGLRVLKSEALWIGLPSLAVVLVSTWLKTRRKVH
ncbi:MAG: metal-dependent hydrolase [Flavobacteriales bacterium]|nr:MAG: metal-dependent hydrolase [Flavobacteriales bacterium]